MAISVIRGHQRLPSISQKLSEALVSDQRLRGQLFLGFPFLPSLEQPIPSDALLVSPDYGLVLFDLVSGNTLTECKARQDAAANRLDARLRLFPKLMQGRNLRIPINTYSFAPASTPQAVNGHESVFASGADLVNAIHELETLSDPNLYDETLSALDGVAQLKNKRPRQKRGEASGTLASKLTELDEALVKFDKYQRHAAIEIVHGVQRIRGLAGSGKTVVLARKAAYLHTLHPKWKIGVTFRTRSLKDMFCDLIAQFVLEESKRPPDWDTLFVINAWGAPGDSSRDGIYHQFCQHHKVQYHDFNSARQQFHNEQPFANVCKSALEEARTSAPFYDVLLIDEAQDLPSSFLRLCFHFTKDPHRLVYAYDELQNLSGESLPPPEQIFGENTDGSPVVRFQTDAAQDDLNDRTLPICYRTPRKVLIAAHSIGFGIYRDKPDGASTNLVQMFDHPHLWNDIGYEVTEGELEEGCHVILDRPSHQNSALLEQHSTADELIQFKCFDSKEAQTSWLAESIRDNLQKDQLAASDIMVVHPHPYTTRSAFTPIQERLFDMKIEAHLAGIDTPGGVFRQRDSDSVTLTGVHRAKGNEAGMVYVINAQHDFNAATNLARVRNQLFTAMTRTRAWLRVSGFGEGMEALEQEYRRLKNHHFRLAFTYPTAVQRQALRVIHRDVTSRQQKRIDKHDTAIDDFLNDLESGEVFLTDVDRTKLARLLERARADLPIRRGP